MTHHHLNGAGVFAAAFLVHALWAGQPPPVSEAPVSGAHVSAANVSGANVSGANVSGTGYPYAHAVCEFGRAGGPECVNPRHSNDAYDWGYWRGGTFQASDPWGYEYRNCTSYVAWRLARSGVRASVFAGLGDASRWIAGVRGEPGVAVNHTPSPGAIAAWDYAGVGHVAWVLSVHGSRVTVSDYNYAGTGVFATHVVNQRSRPSGYIHIRGA